MVPKFNGRTAVDVSLGFFEQSTVRKTKTSFFQERWLSFRGGLEPSLGKGLLVFRHGQKGRRHCACLCSCPAAGSPGFFHQRQLAMVSRRTTMMASAAIVLACAVASCAAAAPLSSPGLLAAGTLARGSIGLEGLLSTSPMYRDSKAWARAGRILDSGPTALVARADSKKDAKKKAKNMSTTEKLRALAPHQKATVLLLAGGVAGAVAKSCVAPLERVKLLSQSGETKLGVLGTMQRVIEEEGMQGLWRGNTVNVLRMIPNKGVLHMTNDMYKDAIKYAMTTIPMCAGISHGTQHFLTGSFAGMTSVIATYPLDLIRTRMAGRLCSGDLCLPYNTWLETAKFTVQNEGVGGLYRGVSPTLIGAFPYEGIKFWSYDFLKSKLPKNADGSQNVGWKLVAGAGGATIAHLITYPMDTVRRRMQMQGAGGAAVLYSNMMDCFVKVAQKEGAVSLYRGLTATCIRGVPNTGIQFAVYEGLKTLMRIV